jgi:hypothetical protein
VPSLTRGRVCNLQFNWLESRRTHNHILLSYLRLPQPEGQVPVFISPRNRVAQLYTRALGSLFVASYDSQGYGGGILTRLHTGLTSFQKSKSKSLTSGKAEQSYVTTDGQSVNMFWCRVHSGLVTRHYFPSEGFCRKMSLSLWGDLSNEKLGLSFVSQSVVICLYEHQVCISFVYTVKRCVDKIYKVSFSPSSVQQIMPY